MVFGAVQKIIDNLRGKSLEDYKREVDCEINQLKYIVYQTTDIKTFPQAKNRLRQIQLTLLEFLRIFDSLCKKHNLSYWLDSGNLLGALRHGGFIPWDDDLDVGMLRDDYDKIIPLLKDDLEKLGFYINIAEKGFNNPIIRILHKDWGFSQIDIFPYDYYFKKIETEKERRILKDKCNNACLLFMKEFSKNPDKSRVNSILAKIYEKYILKGKQSVSKAAIFQGCEFFDGTITNYENVFPLGKIRFEDYEFLAPNNVKAYLSDQYGEYMDWPNKLFQHSSEIVWQKSDDRFQKFLEDLRSKTKEL